MTHWMLFRTEHSHQYYFWNGTNAVLVRNPHDAELNYNTRITFGERETEQIKELAKNKRKKMFEATIIKQRLIVVERGIFTEPEI